MNRIVGALVAALADPEMQKKVAALGLDVVGSTPEQTRTAIATHIPKWAKPKRAKVIHDANIKSAN